MRRSIIDQRALTQTMQTFVLEASELPAMTDSGETQLFDQDDVAPVRLMTCLSFGDCIVSRETEKKITNCS